MKDKRETIVVSLIGAVPVVWLALLIAPHADSFVDVIGHADELFAEPFIIRIVGSSIKTVLLFLSAYWIEI